MDPESGKDRRHRTPAPSPHQTPLGLEPSGPHLWRVNNRSAGGCLHSIYCECDIHIGSATSLGGEGLNCDETEIIWPHDFHILDDPQNGSEDVAAKNLKSKPSSPTSVS
ncbi:hypothetical protein H5410_057952 [Solanum commersonii]|uniref:Uncharacterized protein n=1 Tax=Solanum commersonii TaxID=4109 RepID=A0A9J5WQD3_SOLCO|nr:hypothetical protein H5410_057952 [Solanum commersonii]